MTAEGKLQERVRQVLMNRGWLVNKIIQSSCNGWPDIEAYKKGKCIFVEVKAPGELNDDPLQLFRQDQLRRAGFTVYIILSFDDLIYLP